VFEVEAGGGYFTELYSYAVGSEGAVVMQNFQGFADYAKDEIAARLADNRLANVRVSISMHDALDAEDNSMDVATWVQGPHELYYKPTPDADFGDPQGSFNAIFRIVKRGGAFVVIDHVAAAGAPVTAGNDLHRIDKAHVIALAEGAGFILEAESDFLANPEDDHTLLVFDPKITGKTDQFALRFRKPE
jgi:predicted methyltransferase